MDELCASLVSLIFVVIIDNNMCPKIMEQSTTSLAQVDLYRELQ